MSIPVFIYNFYPFQRLSDEGKQRGVFTFELTLPLPFPNDGITTKNSVEQRFPESSLAAITPKRVSATAGNNPQYTPEAIGNSRKYPPKLDKSLTILLKSLAK